MRYAIYLRKSRSDDPGEPIETTLARHRQALEACMEKLAVCVAPEDVFEEVVSGDSLYARPQMLRLLEGVERGDYAGVLCMDIQRLGRGSMSDQGAILDAFKYSRTKIITPSKTYDLWDESDETYTEFETFLGRQEYKMIKRRLRRGIQATVQSGGYIANAPYGYDKTRVGKTPTLKPNETEAAFVRMMFDLYAAGTGCQRIADRLNQLGAQPRRGSAFNRNTVRAILKNPVYIGKIVWDRKTHLRHAPQNGGKHLVVYHPKEQWTVVEGIHPAIVPVELFQQVQSIFSGRWHPPYYTGKVENALAGLVVCANCGRHMQRQTFQKGGPVLLCLKRGCVVSSRLDLVESALLAQLREEAASLQAKAMQQDGGQEAQSQRRTLRAIETQLATARAQDEKLHDLLEQGVYDTATFLSRHAALAERIASLEQSKAQLAPEPQADHRQMAQRIQAVLDEYPSATPQQRNEMLKSILDKVVYQKPKGAKPAGFHLTVFLLPRYL